MMINEVIMSYYDQPTNLFISYTHGPGIDEPIALTIDNSTYFYIPDIQGSIRAIIGTDGNAVASYQYDAWGNLISYNGTLAQQNDYLYTGREYDWQAGIYYYRARYYNPELGRFLSQDPAGMVDGPNMYVYVRNDPVNGVDALGKMGWACCLQWGWKTIFVAEADTESLSRCISRVTGLSYAAVVGTVISCALLAEFPPACATCISVGLDLSLGAFEVGIIRCITDNTHLELRFEYTCIQPCPGGGGGAPVPGPRPPIVGPLPTRFRGFRVW